MMLKRRWLNCAPPCSWSQERMVNYQERLKAAKADAAKYAAQLKKSAMICSSTGRITSSSGY